MPHPQNLEATFYKSKTVVITYLRRSTFQAIFFHEQFTMNNIKINASSKNLVKTITIDEKLLLINRWNLQIKAAQPPNGIRVNGMVHSLSVCTVFVP